MLICESTKEFVFLTGPSGAGKTTLFKMISAYDVATSGDVKVAGHDLLSIKNTQVPLFEERSVLSFKISNYSRDRTIFENVALPLIVQGDRPQSIQRRVHDVLEQVGLAHKHDQYPEYISGRGTTKNCHYSSSHTSTGSSYRR